MGNFISKNLSLGLTLFAVYWLYKKLDMSSKAVTKPIGNALAEIQMWANGSHPIYREWTGFYLDPDKLGQHYFIRDPYWYKAIVQLNEGNKLLLDEIFTPEKQLKRKYRVLIANEVTPETVAKVRG